MNGNIHLNWSTNHNHYFMQKIPNKLWMLPTIKSYSNYYSTLSMFNNSAASLCAAFSHNFYMRHIFINSFFAMHIVYTCIETLGTSSSSSNCKLRVVQRMYLTKTFCCIVTEAKIIPNDSGNINEIALQWSLHTHY